MDKSRPFSKLRNKLVFYFVIVVLLSFIILSAYHYHLFTAALKQQTLLTPGGSEFLLMSIDLPKTKMLLPILVVSGLAALFFYSITRRIMDPLRKMADPVATWAKTGDLNQQIDSKPRMKLDNYRSPFRRW